MATLKFLIDTSAPNATKTFDAIAGRLTRLDTDLKKTRDISVGNADAMAKIARTQLSADRLRERLGSMDITLRGAQSAEARLLELEATAGRVQDKLNGSGGPGGVQKVADSAKGFGPAWLGPSLALAPVATSLGGVAAGAAIGLGGAAIAGAGALAAFGAVAKPVLADALKAEQGVNTAQNNYNAAIAAGTKQATAYKAEQLAVNKAYADLSPQQIALSKQLGNMASAWDDLKAAETPVVAGALQPWLKSVTDLTTKLAPIISAVAVPIKDLGTQVDHLVNSAAFTKFRDFIAGTGSKVVGAFGGTLIDFVDAFIILLPKFNPLIMTMTNGIAGLGPAVLKWASSKKTADDITKFMAWFHDNGPLVTGLLKNVGGALKALAPGLGPASASELNIISGFFAWIAKLPPSVAKPLADIAGVLLTLNKLGVVSVGVKLLGTGAGSAAAAGGAAAGLWGKLLPGVRLVGGTALAATVIVDTVIKPALQGTSSGKIAGTSKQGNWWDNPGGANPTGTPSQQGVSTWVGLGHQIEHIWDMTWNNTYARLNRGVGDSNKLLNGWWHDTAHWFDLARHDVSSIWDTVWNNTVGRARSGVSGVLSWIGTLPGKLGGVFAKAASWLVGHGKDILTGLWNGAKAVWNTVSGWLGKIGGWILGVFAKAGSWLVGHGRDILTGLWNGLKTVWNTVSGWLGKIGGWIGGVFTKAGSWLYGHGKDIISGLKNGIGDALKDIGNWVKSHVVDPVINWVKHWFGIKSPSTVMAWIGGHLMGGLFKGMMGHDIETIVKKIFGSLPSALGAIVGKGLVSLASLPQKALSALGGLGGKALGLLGKLFGFGGGGGNTANMALGQKMAAAIGWTGANWDALKNLWTGESGWDKGARNASSGAYGIPQSLPASKMASAGADWLTNAATQIKWGLGYIAGTYGNPLNAYTKWLSRSPHWYGQGGDFAAGQLIGVGDRGRELISFGQPGRVFSPEESAALLTAAHKGSDGGSGLQIGQVNVNHVPGYSTPKDVENAIAVANRQIRLARR